MRFGIFTTARGGINEKAILVLVLDCIAAAGLLAVYWYIHFTVNSCLCG